MACCAMVSFHWKNIRSGSIHGSLLLTILSLCFDFAQHPEFIEGSKDRTKMILLISPKSPLKKRGDFIPPLPFSFKSATTHILMFDDVVIQYIVIFLIFYLTRVDKFLNVEPGKILIYGGEKLRSSLNLTIQ